MITCKVSPPQIFIIFQTNSYKLKLRKWVSFVRFQHNKFIHCICMHPRDLNHTHTQNQKFTNDNFQLRAKSDEIEIYESTKKLRSI